MLIQIVIISFALYALSKAFVRYKKEQLSLRELLIWGTFWTIVSIVVLLPNITNHVAAIFGVGRGADFVVYISLLGLFYITFRVYSRLYRLERDVTRLVQEIAFLKQEQKKKNK